MDAQILRGARAHLDLVSVCVLNYNGKHLLKVILSSLLRTNYPRFEIILVDNGSSDDSVSYVRENYPSVKIVWIKENHGIGAGFNAGLAAASGGLVSFLNNDMEVDPNWLLPLVLTLNKYEKVAGCDSKFIDYFEREKINCAGRFMDRYGNGLLRGINEYDKGQYDNPTKVFYCLSLFKKNLIEEAGKFDEMGYVYYEDTDLGWRLYRMGYSMMYVPNSRIYHMVGGTIKNSQVAKKDIKNEYVYHYYKNKLMMLLKNYSGITLIFSILIYCFDLIGLVFIWLLIKQPMNILLSFKGIIWNMKNLKKILKSKKLFINENINSDLFILYTGIWKTIFNKMVGIKL